MEKTISERRIDETKNNSATADLYSIMITSHSEFIMFNIA